MIPNEKQLEKKVGDIVAQANALVIVTPSDYEVAGGMLVGTKNVLKVIDDMYDEIIADANRTHKNACAKKASYATPVKGVKLTLNNKMGKWVHDQEELRKIEEVKAQKAAQTSVDNSTLQQAEALENAGKHDEAQALLNKPPVAPPAVSAPAAPKAKGTSVRKRYLHRVVNPIRIPREYLMLNDSKIRQMVTAHGKLAEQMIPGIEVWEDTKVF